MLRDAHDLKREPSKRSALTGRSPSAAHSSSCPPGRSAGPAPPPETASAAGGGPNPTLYRSLVPIARVPPAGVHSPHRPSGVGVVAPDVEPRARGNAGQALSTIAEHLAPRYSGSA